MFGGALADAIEGLARLAFNCVSCRRLHPDNTFAACAALRNKGSRVFARDAPVLPGAFDVSRIQLVLGDQTTHRRRQALVRFRWSDARDRRGRNGRRCRADSRFCRDWRGSCNPALFNYRERRADFGRHAFLHEYFSNDAGNRRRYLGADLVRFDVEQHLVGLHRVADFLVPLGDHTLGDRLAELRHDDIHQNLLKLPARGLEHDFAADHRHHRLYVLDLVGRHLEVIAVEHH